MPATRLQYSKSNFAIRLSSSVHSLMLQLRSNGAQAFSLLHGFRRLLLYSTSSSPESTHSFTDYLVDSLGFSKQQSLSLSAKLTRVRLLQGAKHVSDFDSIRKSDTIISFLKQNGFEQSHIRHIVSYHPRILHCKIDKTLIPKIEFLRDQGLSGVDLVNFVTKNPVVVTLSLNSCTLPAIQALKEVLGDDEIAFATVNRLHHSSFVGVANNLVHNVALLQSYGLSIELIRKHLAKQPHAYVRETKSFKELLIRVEEKWGIPRDSSMFLYGLNLFSGFKEESIDSKVELFKSFGWSQLDVQKLIRNHPNCLQSSEAKIKKSLKFFMNELGYEPDVIASRPNLLICSLEKRVIPRRRVLSFLKEKGLIKKATYPLCNVAGLSEAVFLKRFVQPYKEVYEVYTEATGRPVELLTQAKADTRSLS